MPKFTKKPITIEALQFTGENAEQVMDFIGIGAATILKEGEAGFPGLRIVTLRVDMIVSVGDYVVEGTIVEFYPCKQDLFEAMYDPASEATEKP